MNVVLALQFLAFFAFGLLARALIDWLRAHT
jgi:hypothetical protein